jgi:hypothetical protein
MYTPLLASHSGGKGRAWWYTPVIPALGRKRQENHKFKASLGNIVKSRRLVHKEVGTGTLTADYP